MTGGTPEGGVRVRAEVLSRGPAGIMQALLGRDPDGLREGDPLPLGWHWFHFKQPIRASSLGADGHERRGDFLPEVDLPRRMWAGGTLRWRGPLVIGEPAELRSRVTGVEEKRGKSGRLVFVTVGQTVLQGGRVCVEEEQEIVYREAGRARPAPATAVQPVGEARSPSSAPARDIAWSEAFLPTAVTLFRFSALTDNAHRIHYDHPYATDVEGYPGLLVHGPLTALLLLDAAGRHGTEAVTRFRYRALAPLFVDRRIALVGRRGSSRSDESRSPAGGSFATERVVEALGPDGKVAMRGWVVRG
ncbi:MAG: MaoC family dehydratase N-terminal domain-containing protein [Gemmatimonadota bacterium]|nr:MaoC family dehydratase N-terminal domain-containing protein [Gemmatimonadota bacterium]MDE2986190.1 MaoC family dehydratase N-terminal domain-containing protein [Gemmatimonadota bacterium]